MSLKNGIVFSEKKHFCDSCLFDRDMTMFSYDLDRSSKIPKIFHNFVSFYRILNYWNDVNKRVVDEFF